MGQHPVDTEECKGEEPGLPWPCDVDDQIPTRKLLVGVCRGDDIAVAVARGYDKAGGVRYGEEAGDRYSFVRSSVDSSDSGGKNVCVKGIES